MESKAMKEMFGTGRFPVLDLSLRDIPLKAQEMAGEMSISGMQPKLSLKLKKGSGELVVAPRGGEYILKPQIQQFPSIPENENCCMDIAEMLGIAVPPHCLLPLRDGSLAYLIKRFDRRRGIKIHQEDFCQILQGKDKYLGSLEQIGKRLREISSVPGLDVQLLFERVVFHFLIGNGDGHLKNYSVSYHESGARLSPAYDILCSKLVLPKEEDSALAMNGKKNNLATKDFDAFADVLNMPPRVRYEKFVGKCGRIKEWISDSRLPNDFKVKFAQIVSSRYERLGIQP